MRSRVMSYGLAAVLLPVLMLAAAAKTPRLNQTNIWTNDNVVTIVTEAPSGSDDADGGSIQDLAKAFAASGFPRILPVVGLGPIANTRDLLHTRGIDMAVVDADITAYAKLEGGLHGAEQRLSAVMKLSENTVYLVAGPDVHSAADLAGQQVIAPGADSDSRVTARVVFSLLSIPVQLGAADLDRAAEAVLAGQAKALLIVAGADGHILSRLPQNRGLHLVAIPWVENFSSVYISTRIKAGDAVGFAPANGVETVSVSRLLATFNWRPQLYRYQPVLQFIRNLPAAVQWLRQNERGVMWAAMDGRSGVPGWQRFETAGQSLAGITPDATMAEAQTETPAVPKPIPTAVAATAKLGTPVASPSAAAAPAPTPASQVSATGPAGPAQLAATGLQTKSVVTMPTKTALSPIGSLKLVAIEPLPLLAALPGVKPAITETLELAAYPLPGLVEPKVPSGGLIAELVAASLNGQPTKLAWSVDGKSMAERVLGATGSRLGMPWSKPDCDHKAALTASDAKMCDTFLFSKPVLQTLKLFFVRHGSDFTFEHDDQVAGHIICAAASENTDALDTPERQWIKQEMLTLLRRSSVDECLAALDRNEVDAVFTDDFTGLAVIERLGIADHVEVVSRPVAFRELSAIAPKSDPKSAELIGRLNDGLAALKASGRYWEIVMRRFGPGQLSSRDARLVQ